MDADVMKNENKSPSPKKSVGRDVSMASVGQGHSQEDDILVYNEVLHQAGRSSLTNYK
jgi:hypothetical protein